MRIASMRVVSAVVVASLTVTCLSPLAQAQDVVGAAESTPLEQAEQPMAPPVRADEPAPPADPTVAQVQPAPPPVMPPPPAPPAAVTPPAMQPAHPDLFQETLKAQQPGAGKAVLYGTGAVVTNIFLIPGRVITCALGGGLGVAVLAITFGTGYKAAASVWDEGCGGKWVVSGDDLRPEGNRAFDWER